MTPPAHDLGALAGLLDAVDSRSDIPVSLGMLRLQDLRHAEYLHHDVSDMAAAPEVPQRKCRRAVVSVPINRRTQAHASPCGVVYPVEPPTPVAADWVGAVRRRQRLESQLDSSTIWILNGLDLMAVERVARETPNSRDPARVIVRPPVAAQ